jgi:flavin reductase (DIM6/NTAB) family NADH-FMN oxidoreductase RutF
MAADGVTGGPSPEEFRDAIGRFASGVTVITAKDGSRSVGTTASAVTSLSAEPPMALVCLNLDSQTGTAVRDNHRFAINVLREGQEELARLLATKDPDKFDDVAVETGSHGQPLLTDALARLECDVVETITGGTHLVFVGAVRSVSVDEGDPLAYFRGSFGRLELGLDPLLRRGVDRSLLPVVEDRIDGRRALELGVAETVSGLLEADRLAELRLRMGEALTAVGTDPADAQHFARADHRFHEGLVGLTGSKALLRAYRHFEIVALAGLEGMRPDDGGRLQAEQHRALVEALEVGDRRLAGDLIRAHAERDKEVLRSSLSASTDADRRSPVGN